MSDKPSQKSPLDMLRERLAEKERRLAEEQQTLAQERELLALAERLGYEVIPPASKAAASAPAQPTPAVVAPPWAKPTWNLTMLHLIESVGPDRGITHEELWQKVQATPQYQSGQLVQGFKNFYGAMERLKRRNEIVSYGGMLYKTQVYKDLLAKGVPLPKVRRRRPGMKSDECVLDLLGRNPEGMTFQAMHKQLYERQDVPRRFRLNDVYLKEVVGKLEAAGTIVKQDGVYRLPKKAKGRTSSERPAPQVQLWSGSDAAPHRH